MKNTENNKKLYRRYLDDLYTTEDARQLLNSLHDPDNHEHSMSCLPMSGKKPPHSNLIQILNVNTINERHVNY